MVYSKKWSPGFESSIFRQFPFLGLNFSIHKMDSGEEGGWTQCYEASRNIFFNSLFPTPPAHRESFEWGPLALGVCYEVSSSVPFPSPRPVL